MEKTDDRILTTTTVDLVHLFWRTTLITDSHALHTHTQLKTRAKHIHRVSLRTVRKSRAREKNKGLLQKKSAARILARSSSSLPCLPAPSRARSPLIIAWLGCPRAGVYGLFDRREKNERRAISRDDHFRDPRYLPFPSLRLASPPPPLARATLSRITQHIRTASSAAPFKSKLKGRSKRGKVVGRSGAPPCTTSKTVRLFYFLLL